MDGTTMNTAMRCLEEHFPLRVCLNLARRLDRRLRAWEEFRREGLTVERLVAPDAGEMSGLRVKQYRGVGPRACALAHRLAWREARRQAVDAILVLEDDVVLAPSFRSQAESWLATVPDDWDFLYFGCVFRDPPQAEAPGLVRVTGRTWDLHAYAARTRVTSVLDRAVRRLNGTTPLRSEERSGPHDGGEAIDTAIASHHGRLRVYACWPPLAWQEYGHSNNESNLRGNYRKDGQQAIFRESLVALHQGA